MSDLTPPLEFKTFDLAYVVEETGAPSEDWLMRKIRKRVFTARKSGRHWRMTHSDMAAVVEYMKQPAKTDTVSRIDEQPAARRTGLTDRARRNLARTA